MLSQMEHSALDAHVGQVVRLAIVEDGATTNHYRPQMAMSGKLEKHPIQEAYRVVVKDDIFTYFGPENVVLVNTLISPTLITLKIDVKPE